MADKIVLVDTSMLIDLFRKTDKTKSALITLVRGGYTFCISAITEYEIYTGADFGQVEFWDDFLKKVARIAVDLNRSLKKKTNRYPGLVYRSNSGCK